MANVGIGIFLDGERRRGVLDKKREQAFTHTLALAPIGHRVRDVVKPRTICFSAKSVRYLPHIARVSEEKLDENQNQLKLKSTQYAALSTYTNEAIVMKEYTI